MSYLGVLAMNKNRIIVISIVILACVGGAFWLLERQPKQQPVHIDTIGVIPFDAIFIAQFKELALLNRIAGDSTNVWNMFITGKPALLRWLNRAVVSFSHDETATFALHAKTTLSAHPLGKNDLALLCCIALPPTVNITEWERFLSLYGQSPDKQQYQDHAIVSLRFESGLIYFSYVKGVVLISTSDILLQAAIRHSSSGESLEQNPQFVTARQTLGSGVDVALLINHRQLPRLMNNLGNKLGEAVNTFFSHAANWTAVDGQISDNQLQLNGFVFPAMTNNNFLNVLLHQSGHNVEAWDALPASTASLLSFTLNDPVRFLSDYAGYLEKQNNLNSYKQAAAALDKQWTQHAAEFFASLYPAELCVAVLPGGARYSKVSMLRTVNRQYALEQLKALSGHLQLPFVDRQEQSGNNTITIYNNPAKGLLHVLIGQLFPAANDQYFMLADDWFYFSDDRDVLKNLAIQSAGNSFKRRLYQTEAAQYLSNNTSVAAIANAPQLAGKELLGLLHPDFEQLFKKITGVYARNITAMQLRPSGDKFFINFFTFYDVEPKAPETAANSNAVATPANNVPATVAPRNNELLRVSVINHYTKEKEFFVQYTDNSLGLLSKEGKLLWRKKFNEAITGAVIQIDYLNNKKLQCLFCTGKQLHLYDRNGNTVKPFPINLKQPVTLVEGSAANVQKQPPALKLTKDGKTTIIYLKDGKVENK